MSLSASTREISSLELLHEQNGTDDIHFLLTHTSHKSRPTLYGAPNRIYCTKHKQLTDRQTQTQTQADIEKTETEIEIETQKETGGNTDRDEDE